VGVAKVQGFEGNLGYLKGSKNKNESLLLLAFNGTHWLDIKALLEGNGKHGVEQDAPLTDEQVADARLMSKQASSSSQHSMASS